MAKDREDYTKQWMTEMLERLNVATKDCNVEMHEPDNSDVSAIVVGNKLDNAMGDAIIPEAIVNGWQEYVVIINTNGKTEAFNLACLIALARKAVVE